MKTPTASLLAAVLLAGTGAPLQAAPPPPALKAPVASRSPGDLHPEVVSLLERPGAFPYEVAALEHPQATERLQALLEDTDAQSVLRARAATALGLRMGADAVTPLLPFLQDRDASVRAAVARALGRLGGAQAQQALEERLSLEETLLVREALQQGLTLTIP